MMEFRPLLDDEAGKGWSASKHLSLLCILLNNTSAASHVEYQFYNCDN